MVRAMQKSAQVQFDRRLLLTARSATRKMKRGRENEEGSDVKPDPDLEAAKYLIPEFSRIFVFGVLLSWLHWTLQYIR